MIRMVFTQNLRRHVACSELEVEGRTVDEVLEGVFSAHPEIRSYILEDRGGIRDHIIVFINGEPVQDRRSLSDPVPDGAEVYVMQALSGG